MKCAASIVAAICSVALCRAQVPDPLLQARPNEMRIGPVSVSQPVSGVTVTLRASSFVAASLQDGEAHLAVRTVTDLADLQAKVGAILDTVPLPSNPCDHFGLDNLVASIPGKQLTIDGPTATATIALHGEAESWTCTKNVPCSRADWEEKTVLGRTVRVPKVTLYDCNPPLRKRIAGEPFDARLPFTIVVADPQTVAFQLGQPSVNLSGTLGGISGGILRIAGVDLNAEVREMLAKAITPDMLRQSVPPELSQLHPRIERAALFDNGGKLAATIDMTAVVPAASMNDFVRLLTLNAAGR